ncbi:hypothetical protein F5Y15DRAFT_410980 [Xylariaceae sp. FL0016]|nr:hypothetical protein F5Y15DRAFT_410980 [Xylariaceae sp. FL0016]
MDKTAIQSNLSIRLLWTGLRDIDEDNMFSTTGGISIPVDLLPETVISAHALSDKTNTNIQSGLQVGVLHSNGHLVAEVGPPSDFLVEELANLNLKDELFFETLLNWDTVIRSWWQIAGDGWKFRRSNQQGFKPIDGREAFDRSDFLKTFHLTLTAGKFSIDPSDLLSNSSDPEQRAQQYDAYLAARAGACTGRRLFSLVNGSFGLGPADIQVGDEICGVIGSQVPMVLRRTIPYAQEVIERMHYQPNERQRERIYVGQAYVRDLMNYEGDPEADIRDGQVKVRRRWLV